MMWSTSDPSSWSVVSRHLKRVDHPLLSDREDATGQSADDPFEPPLFMLRHNLDTLDQLEAAIDLSKGERPAPRVAIGGHIFLAQPNGHLPKVGRCHRPAELDELRMIVRDLVPRVLPTPEEGRAILTCPIMRAAFGLIDHAARLEFALELRQHILDVFGVSGFADIVSDLTVVISARIQEGDEVLYRIVDPVSLEVFGGDQEAYFERAMTSLDPRWYWEQSSNLSPSHTRSREAVSRTRTGCGLRA